VWRKRGGAKGGKVEKRGMGAGGGEGVGLGVGSIWVNFLRGGGGGGGGVGGGGGGGEHLGYPGRRAEPKDCKWR
jgi:hypothetical protein